jgi:hypothetical protein
MTKTPKRSAKKKTTAARARALLDAGTAPAVVRRKLRTSRQAVAAADARRKPIGRPAELERIRVTLYLSPDAHDWLRAEAHRDGCSLGEVVDGAHLAITAADAGEDPALARARALERHAEAVLLGDACFRLQLHARGLAADARGMRESFPELAIGHAERAAALSMAARVLLGIETPGDFDLCAVRARAGRIVPAIMQDLNAVRARADTMLQQTAARHEADARAVDRDPRESAFPAAYHRERAAELRATYGDPDQHDAPE